MDVLPALQPRIFSFSNSKTEVIEHRGRRRRAAHLRRPSSRILVRGIEPLGERVPWPLALCFGGTDEECMFWSEETRNAWLRAHLGEPRDHDAPLTAIKSSTLFSRIARSSRQPTINWPLPRYSRPPISCVFSSADMKFGQKISVCLSPALSYLSLIWTLFV